MNANRTLNRLFLICSLALPAAFALGQAPDSFSGWTVLLDGSDPGVSEKLEFTGASTLKSTFSDGGQSFTSTETYTFTKTGANTAEIATPNTDGSEDKYLFQFTSSEGGTGELKDYVMGNYAGQSSYQHVSGNLYLDLSGSWNFTFEKLPAWEDYDDFADNTLDAAQWETGYWPGAQAPTEVNGRIELSGTGINSGTKHPSSFNELFSAGMPSNGTHHSILALQESEFLGIEAELTLPATNTFGSGVYLGIMEKISATSIGFVGPELGLWGATPSLSFENSVYENGNEVVDEDLDKVVALGQSYRVSILKSGDKYRLYLDDELMKEYPVRGTNAYFHFAAFHDQGQSFTAYVDNVRVLRSGQSSTEPQATTVVSTPDGKPVVVKVGDTYKWNSTLDGVTLWGVGQDGNEWSPVTAKFVGGNILYGFDLQDDVEDTQNNKVTYIIDENGYIKSLEHDGEYQYYNAVSVEGGVIGTIQNDQGLESVANNGVNVVDQWFFTTKSAAEEYYYSKAGYPKPKGWMWFDQYPWVYSDEEQGWLYFRPSGDKLHYWSHKYKTWQEYVPK